MQVHVFWEGPFTLEQLPKLTNENIDHGVYQIYGFHPLYGHSVLLYIGQAISQTFGKRISQEGWDTNEDYRNVEIYVGRLAIQKFKNVGKELLADLIDGVEKLLIYAHSPAYNTQNTRTLPESKVLQNRIFNWDSYRDLFPEVSGYRYTSKFDHIDDTCVISMEDV